MFHNLEVLVSGGKLPSKLVKRKKNVVNYTTNNVSGMAFSGIVIKEAINV